MEERPLISIIVPVYNAAIYLPQCIESLQNQTYQNLQIICVNDGSKDNSWEILHHFEKSDKRIILINKNNEGVSAARNSGLLSALGDYIMFVDADDWIDRDTCAIAVDALLKEKADVVLWSYVSENKDIQSFKRIFDADRVFDETECREKLHRRFVGIIGDELAHPELADSLCPVWGKLYRRDIICKSKAQFVDLSDIGTYEDGLFNLEVFGYVYKAVYINHCFYHYRRDNSGSATSNYNPDLFDRWQNLYSLMRAYIKDKRLPEMYSQALQNRIALGILGLTLNISMAQKSPLEKNKELKRILRSKQYAESLSMLDIKKMPLRWKVFYQNARIGNASILLLAGEAYKRLPSIRH